MTLPPKLDLTETTIHSDRIWEGKVVNLKRDIVSLPNGKQGFREVVEHPGGVVVLPILPDGRILFVEQYRYALGEHLLELPAGKLEPGENPMAAIQRELMEETGYEAKAWEELSYIYTAPGFCSEKLWLYRATELVQLADAHKDPTIHLDEDEFLRCIALTLDEARAKIRTREIVDAKTVSLLALGFCF